MEYCSCNINDVKRENFPGMFHANIIFATEAIHCDYVVKDPVCCTEKILLICNTVLLQCIL